MSEELQKKVGEFLDGARDDVKNQFGEIVDSSIGNAKTTILGMVAGFMVLNDDLTTGNWMPENMSDVKTWVFAAALALLGAYIPRRN